MKKDKNNIEIDFSNSWIVDKIGDRNNFLKRIIELIPSGSIWTMKDIIDKDLLDFFAKYAIDSQFELKGKRSINVIVNSESRKFIIDKLNDLSFDWSIIEQHIYKDDSYYFSSYDDLSSHATWISKDFSIQDFSTLITNNDISLIDSLDWPNKSIQDRRKGISLLNVVKKIGWVLFGILSIIVIGHIIAFFNYSFQDPDPLIPDSLIKMQLLDTVIETFLFAFLSFGLFIGLRRTKKVIYLVIINLIIILTLIYRMSIVGLLYRLLLSISN